jgi:hypothetical protein
MPKDCRDEEVAPTDSVHRHDVCIRRDVDADVASLGPMYTLQDFESAEVAFPGSTSALQGFRSAEVASTDATSAALTELRS